MPRGAANPSRVYASGYFLGPSTAFGAAGAVKIRIGACGTEEGGGGGDVSDHSQSALDILQTTNGVPRDVTTLRLHSSPKRRRVADLQSPFHVRG
jgi:hypothetical protein